MHNTKNAPVVIYTSSSQAGSLPKLIGSMAKDLIASRELSWRLFIRDISAQYRQSLFGILWAFIPPIITSLIFIVLQSRNVLNFGETDIPYPAYVFVGTLLWQIFADSLNAPLKAAVAAQALLAKINFPREALIVSSVYMVVFNALIKGIVLVVVILLFRLQPAWGIVFAPVMILFLIFLGISLGTLITPIGLLYTDVATSLPILIQLAFFVTPVVYEPPTSFPLSLIAVLNPVSPLLIAARDLLTIGTIDNFIAPLIVSILTILLVLVSWIFYRLAIPIIIERMSA